MGLRDELVAAKPRRLCNLMLLKGRTDLPYPYDEIVDVVFDTEISSIQLADKFRTVGIPLSETTIRRHRRGLCCNG